MATHSDRLAGKQQQQLLSPPTSTTMSPRSPKIPPSALQEPIEVNRAASPTLKLACKQLGLTVDALREPHVPRPAELKRLPEDVAKVRIEHGEQRRQQLVMLVRRKYLEIKSAEREAEQRAGRIEAFVNTAQASWATAETPSAASPSKGANTVVDRQLEKLEKKRREDMERWVKNNERMALEERAQAQAEEEARARQRELQRVRAQVKKAQEEQRRLREDAETQEQARQEALYKERQREEMAKERDRLLGQDAARLAARKEAREKDEEAKRRIEARKRETQALLAAQDAEIQRRAQSLAQRQAESARKAAAEKQERVVKMSESRARAAARVEAAALKHDRELEAQRSTFEAKQRALEERRQQLEQEQFTKLIAQREAYEQRAARRVFIVEKVEKQQQTRVSTLLHKLARQEAAMAQVQQAAALQAMVRTEKRKLREYDTRENIEMLARSQVFGELCMRQKFMQDDDKSRQFIAVRQAQVERSRQEMQAQTLERQKMAEMLGNMQRRGNVDADMMGSMAPSAPNSPRPSSAIRAPRPHTASPRVASSSAAEAAAEDSIR